MQCRPEERAFARAQSRLRGSPHKSSRYRRINFTRSPHIAADGKAYAYNYNRILSDLYLVDGLR
jgi:hypothetical protein